MTSVGAVIETRSANGRGHRPHHHALQHGRDVVGVELDRAEDGAHDTEALPRDPAGQPEQGPTTGAA